MRFVTLTFVLAISGCDWLGLGVECKSILIPAISLALEDAETGAAVVSDDITVVFTDGSFADTLRFSSTAENPRGATLHHDRPGTYDIEVRAAGYSLWTQNDVRVDADGDGCHAVTAEITATLEPLD